jgi:hypothetical protein
MTTDEDRIRNQAVEVIVKGVARRTALIVSIASAGVLAFGLLQGTEQPWWFLPASVLFGGILGLLNFRWLAIAVQRVYLRRGATSITSNLAAVIISILKLSLIFIILFIVIKWRLLQVFGMVAGLSLCFLAILWEGTTMMKQTLNSGDK